jgi:hypothetical protein
MTVTVRLRDCGSAEDAGCGADELQRMTATVG